jgi:very-short-patch-repair endonuclease
VKKPRLSEAQQVLVIHLKEILVTAGRFDIHTEFPVAPYRKWRFDIAVPAFNWAFEIDGGAWSHGRHTRGAGFIKDMEKLNTAAALGWKVFRFTPDQVLKGEAKEFIQKWL